MMYPAVVARLSPLEVTIPGVTRHDSAIRCETMVTVAVGDLVWVTQVAGTYGWVLVGPRPTAAP